MQNQFVHPAKKYATTTNIPPYNVPYCQYSFILQGWHIYIQGVGLFLVLCSPSIIISIGYLQENEG